MGVYTLEENVTQRFFAGTERLLLFRREALDLIDEAIRHDSTCLPAWTEKARRLLERCRGREI